MTKILAVSGGVDSMVLLDQFLQINTDSIIVAHFHHGTRPSADDDAAFVQRISAKLNVPCIIERADLGPNVSESTARLARYHFLNQTAHKYHGQIYTAHHLDDLVESIAINLIRGTGWRGLAVMDNKSIQRPFISSTFNKQIYDRRDILKYAAQHHVTYRQDPTNAEPTYLRNRLRPLLINLSRTTKLQLLALRNRQITLASQIQSSITTLLPPTSVIPRQIFRDLPDDVALELLRHTLNSRLQLSLTRPQLADFLAAIRTYAPSKKFNLPSSQFITIHKDYFIL